MIATNSGPSSTRYRDGHPPHQSPARPATACRMGSGPRRPAARRAAVGASLAMAGPTPCPAPCPALQCRHARFQSRFQRSATLRKWPSVNNERVSASLGARTYMIIEGTLDECIRKFMLHQSRSVICMKLTRCRSRILSARSCRQNTSSSWRV
jgi:hypothetical protein